MKTDNSANDVTMNYRVPTGEQIVGDLHTHQDDVAGRPAQMRCSLDIGDVYALSGFGFNSKQDFASFVEMGNTRQVIVVEDPIKAAAYINVLKRKDYINTWTSIAFASPLYWTNYSQASLNATLSMLGNSATSGIGFYQTTDIDKVVFTKLN